MSSQLYIDSSFPVPRIPLHRFIILNSSWRNIVWTESNDDIAVPSGCRRSQMVTSLFHHKVLPPTNWSPNSSGVSYFNKTNTDSHWYRRDQYSVAFWDWTKKYGLKFYFIIIWLSRFCVFLHKSIQLLSRFFLTSLILTYRDSSQRLFRPIKRSS